MPMTSKHQRWSILPIILLLLSLDQVLPSPVLDLSSLTFPKETEKRYHELEQATFQLEQEQEAFVDGMAITRRNLIYNYGRSGYDGHRGYDQVQAERPKSTDFSLNLNWFKSRANAETLETFKHLRALESFDQRSFDPVRGYLNQPVSEIQLRAALHEAEVENGWKALVKQSEGRLEALLSEAEDESIKKRQEAVEAFLVGSYPVVGSYLQNEPQSKYKYSAIMLEILVTAAKLEVDLAGLEIPKTWYRSVATIENLALNERIKALRELESGHLEEATQLVRSASSHQRAAHEVEKELLEIGCIVPDSRNEESYRKSLVEWAKLKEDYKSPSALLESYKQIYEERKVLEQRWLQQQRQRSPILGHHDQNDGTKPAWLLAAEQAASKALLFLQRGEWMEARQAIGEAKTHQKQEAKLVHESVQ